MILNRLLVITAGWLLLLPGMLSAQATTHVLAQLQPGDGINALLRRYDLFTDCNRGYFQQINDLNRNASLVLHRDYELPILVFTYNGRSIRTTTGNNDYDWAVQVQQYNERMHRLGLKAGDYREDKVLWVPYHMLHCRDEMTETDTGTLPTPDLSTGPMASTAVANPPLRGTYPIFGPDYAAVPLESNRLRGFVYYVVAGHGGPDPGAIGQYQGQSLCEDEYAYDVALRLARNLLSYGATVYLITRDDNDGIRSGEILPCDQDETAWVNAEIPINQVERLTQRSDAVNELYRRNASQGVQVQRLVIIHVDSNSQNKRMDMFFYHRLGDTESARLAEGLRQTIKRKYDEYRQGRGYDGTVSGRDLHMLRETEPTAVFVELGNIRNRNDQARLVIEGNRQLIANWLLEGFLQEAP